MRELLMIHALDERDLLRSRIMGKIGKITFLDYKKQCEERTAETLMEEKSRWMALPSTRIGSNA